MNGSAKKQNKIDPHIKDVLLLLSVSGLVTASIIAPGIGALADRIIKEHDKLQRQSHKRESEMYNPWRLRQLLKRLHNQKIIEIKSDVVSITEKGKRRLLKYRLDGIVLARKRDGLWRYIFYDIANIKDHQRRLLHSVLARLKFLQVQRSVYLTPFICDDEIEFLRQIFDIGVEVQIVKVQHIENEQAYKTYFGV